MAERPYHHGDLRRALVDAGVGLARSGGPGAVMLREVTRRVGVSPTAAYRHFADLPQLLDAVAEQARAELAAAMRDEVVAEASASPTRPALDAAKAQLLAVGRAYVRFALREPGLFASAFTQPKAQLEHTDGLPERPGPGDYLQHALDELIRVGLLDPEHRRDAITTAWAAVHGLSGLLLGPLGAVPEGDRQPLIDGALALVLRGLLRTEGDKPPESVA